VKEKEQKEQIEKAPMLVESEPIVIKRNTLVTSSQGQFSEYRLSKKKKTN